MPRKRIVSPSLNDIVESFGLAVRSLRIQRGYSQEQLAERSQLDQTYLSGIERGVRNPTLRVIARLADGLGVTLGELFQAASDVGGIRRDTP